MRHPTRQTGRRLFSLALEQGGYFTAKQARQVGYDYPHLEYHLACGNFARVGHGLYRLPDLPPSEHDDLLRFTWWSRNRQDQPQAVVSHESALALHELSDLLPTATHLTVPPGFRKKAPPGCVLHREELSPADVEERPGFRVTTPLRTLLDVARGDLRQEQLAKAVADALDRGLVRRGRLAAAVRADPNLRRLAFVLREDEAPAS